MEIETLRNYCLSLPQTTEDMAFGDDVLLFRVCGHIFTCLNLLPPATIALKCDAVRAIELREQYPQIEPARYWNKKYWNQLRPSPPLTENFIKSLIRHSYSEVVRKLPKQIKTTHPEITTIN